MSRFLIKSSLFCFVTFASITARAVVVPVGLNPGDSYYLAFFTDDNRDATSTDITVYDQFVMDQAAMNPTLTGTDVGVQYRAMASVDGLNARDHADVDMNVPVYLLDGVTKIADGFTDLWDGTLDNDLALDQFLGGVNQNGAWTGSLDDGTQDPGNTLGTSDPQVGVILTTGGNQWFHFNTSLATNNFPMYALSTKLTVVPEPSALCFAAFGGLVLGMRRRQRA